jgi:tetratricopeptide (TPR) repeat protein
MEQKIIIKINELEKIIGFSLKFKNITLKSKESHDESFSYGLSMRFYNKNNELIKTIIKTKQLLYLVKKRKKSDKITIESLYSLIGNMYYILGNYSISAGYFMKCITLNKKNITFWIELLFSLRAMGEFELFEKGIFNLEKMILDWDKSSKKKKLNKNNFLKLIKKINN